LVAGAGVEGQDVGCHACMLRRVRCGKWSDSDMLMAPPRPLQKKGLEGCCKQPVALRNAALGGGKIKKCFL
jgi:hypothetical protein